jgi:hypothetical protein
MLRARCDCGGGDGELTEETAVEGTDLGGGLCHD